MTQAGADSNASAYGGSSQYEFWVEDYPLDTIWENSPTIKANDTVYVSVTYGGSTSTAFLENETTGNYTSVNFSTPYFFGGSAEYINEAIGDNYNNWSSWGKTTFSQCSLEWDTVSGAKGGGEFDVYKYTEDLLQSNGVTYSTPSTPSNGSFTITASN